MKGIEYILNDCIAAWYMVTVLTGILALLTPLFYANYLIKNKQTTQKNIWNFNFSEYIFLQGSLVIFWTDGKVACFGHAGQNGLEYAFTAWTGLFLIFGLNLLFDKLIKTKLT